MDFQFYPTPQHLAHKAWSLFKQPVQLLLEPHGGKGDLAHAYRIGFPEVDTDSELSRLRHRFGWETGKVVRDLKWHTCEINPDMHPILKERGATIVGYDFLQMQSAARFSHILANPPFADGDKHLLHAWKIAHAAEIVFILNAETIRNPFSATRQKVVELIEKHGHVQFLADQFIGSDVERQTSVEIALVYLKKEPEALLNLDKALEGLKPATSGMNTYGAPELNALALPMDFIDRVVEDYEIACKASVEFAHAQALLSVAENRLGLTFEEMVTKGLTANDRPKQTNPADVVRNVINQQFDSLRERAWAQILRSTKLLDSLSVAARKEVESQFQTIQLLEFNKVNVHGFFAGVLDNLGNLNDKMILTLFDSILERDTDNAAFYQSWKSNQKHKALGMRIKRTRFILPLARGDYSTSRYASHGVLSALADIDKVFRLLDGKHTIVQPDKNGLVIDNGLRACFNDDRKFSALVNGERLDTEYLSVRYYPGKGTIHFFPRNMDVIERFNRYVGRIRQWLPPDMEKADKGFVEQYEKAEKLTPAYCEAFNKNRSSYYYSSPVYSLLKNLKGVEESNQDVLKLIDAVQTVQHQHGIVIGDQLEQTKVSEEQLQLAWEL